MLIIKRVNKFLNKNNILCDRLININIHDTVQAYSMMMTSSKIPYYIPTSKAKISDMLKKNVFIEEILFFPVEQERILHHHNDFFYGYLFLITSNGHDTLSLTGEPELGLTKLQIQYDVRRIRYFINKNNNIEIDEIRDPLFPTGLLEIQESSSEIGEIVSDFISTLIDTYCQYYLTNNI